MNSKNTLESYYLSLINNAVVTARPKRHINPVNPDKVITKTNVSRGIKLRVRQAMTKPKGDQEAEEMGKA